ncbi:hypothetical protein [Candidatus Accumulibacter sp. ACC007]|uniref:hypothetical protein n=1 Tax=Candidatus Accumulibacter sp. ACC007 TaxID=2823333 RepID=UPI0025C650F6|nr:hypothetical protein [Candidatus Accumulibacter sp. ACC007]
MSGAAGRSTLRSFLAIDERETLVQLAQTVRGRVLLFAVAVLAVSTYNSCWEAAFVVGAAMAFAYLEKQRQLILFAATYLMAFSALWLSETAIEESIAVVAAQERAAQFSPLLLAHLALITFMIFSWLTLMVVRSHKGFILARRPVVALLTVEFALCGLTSLDLVHGLPRLALWSFLSVYTPYIWFLAYAIVDQRARDRSPDAFQLGTFHPFWGGPSSIPFGKGAGFLRKNLSKTPADLAITQIKGVKLLLWSNVLLAMKVALTWICEQKLSIPSVELALGAYLDGQAFPVLIGWSALVWSTAKFCLRTAYWGHLFIGGARLAGFRLPRATWRPLEARTLIEYFNRFSYYFKELLVDFFFVPTFFRVFRKHPRLRMFFATFMAAGVGNVIFHFVREVDLVAAMGVSAAIESFTSYAFYCLVLATGIGISQVRANAGYRPSSTLAGRLWSFVTVWGFVVCLHVFSDESRRHTLLERWSFLASLFGVG